MKITKSQLRQMIKEEINERCQKGYKTHEKRKTKKMFGKQYRNCVKAEAMEEEPARKEILYDFRVRLYDPKTKKMTGKTARVDARDRDHAREIVNSHLEQKGSDLRASSDVYNMDIPAD